MNSLHIVVRGQTGQVAVQAIGQALVAAAETADTAALQRGLLALACYQAYSPSEAAEAMRTLAELGDVPFEASDFQPRWWQPSECVEDIDVLLERGRRGLSEPVRAELAVLRQALAEAERRTCTFYLVDLEPDEELPLEWHNPRGAEAPKGTRGADTIG